MNRMTSYLMGCVILLGVKLVVPDAMICQPAMPVPDASPMASVTQTIGLTEITITYHRPGVKGRTIWGSLVPYNEVWRAGANENTTISFPTDVRIEGKDLPAGTYGLHMIPSRDEWTVIFSRNATSWGSYYYHQAEDALRITITPVATAHQEWLAYAFDDLTDSSATISLRWEKLSIPIHVHVNTHAAVLDNARNVYLRGIAGFGWQGYYQAANYCLTNNINLDEAMRWIDRSIELNETFNNLRVKSGLLEKAGNPKEAERLMERALAVAAEADLNAYGYQLMGSGRTKEAIVIFQRNMREHPESWNAYDSIAEAYERSGDTKRAVEFYRKALDRVKDETNRARIVKTIDRLSAE